MPWMVVLHVAFMSVWFGCQIAIPLLLAEHQREARDPNYDPDRRIRFLLLERSIYMTVMTSAAVLTVLSGSWLLVSHGFEGGWLPVKLAFVTLLAFNHIYQGKIVGRLRDGIWPKPWALKVQPLLALLIATPIITLVVGKPF